MRKKLPALLVFFVGLLLGINQVVAEDADDSVFANISDKKASGRKVTSVDDVKIEDYQSMREEYLSFKEEATTAYGSRKTELLEKIFARGKDVLISKLGGVSYFLNDLSEKIGGVEGISVEEKSSLISTTEDFGEEVSGYVDEVEAVEVVSGLGPVSSRINEPVNSALNSVRFVIVLLNISTVDNIVGEIDVIAPVVQDHISAASERGNDVSEEQETYDGAMLLLDDVRESLASLKSEVESDEVDKSSEAVGEYYTTAKEINDSLGEIYSDFSSVLSSLENIYSGTPWSINGEY